MAQKRDGQQCKFIAKPGVFGEKQYLADEKDNVTDPQFSFIQTDQWGEHHYKKNNVLHR